MEVEQENRSQELITDEDMGQFAQAVFDRDVTFEEVFLSSLGQEFLNWLSELLTRDFMVTGRDGQTKPVCPNSKKAPHLPKPPPGTLQTKPIHIKGPDGICSVGIPVFHEGNPFAILIFEDDVLGDRKLLKKLRIVANMIEWYIQVVYQQRMIFELHDQAQKSSFGELTEEHRRVRESEKKYRELAETLERRVQERKEELEKAQRQLIQQEKMASIGELAAGVAHEINNPTGFVNSNLQTLKKYHSRIIEVLKISQSFFKSNGTPESEEFFDKWKRLDMDYMLEDLPSLVDESLRGTDRIIRIVRGLSRFSHMDQDEQDWININELLDSAVELLWNEIKYKAEIIKDYGELPKIRGNPNQLSQVFVNLIINALQAMEKRGTLTLVTRPGILDIEIQVRDNGKGISPENLPKIFNPFFTTKPVGQGTGLGLSISYEIITGHDGDIHVESKPSEGTTFYVRLPIEPGKEE